MERSTLMLTYDGFFGRLLQKKTDTTDTGTCICMIHML